jgi:micrococcal nuclease
MTFLRFLVPLLVSCGAADAAKQSSRRDFSGPVSAIVESVLDGDTFRAQALVWPGHTVTVNIRIRGIDAPEIKSRCRHERDAAHRARDALARMIGDAPVSISNISGAKYYGRVLADVASSDGRSLATGLIDQALVRAYRGGKRKSWC